MAEKKFESEFHRKYVGGKGEVEEKPFVIDTNKSEVRPLTVEDVLEEYRKYVHDPEAKLPLAIIEELKEMGKIPKDE